MPPENLTMLIDGSYALHRVLKVGGDSNPFAHMSSSDGVMTGGVFAYLLSLSKSLATFNVKSVVNVWDSGVYSARRLAVYKGYKSSRTASRKTKEGREYFSNFDLQKTMVEEFLKTLGIPSVTIKAKEADDVIGYLAKHIAGPILILSDDKDYWHLIDKHVCVYRPVKDKYLDFWNFAIESKGFRAPWRYLLYCSIIGDTGDDVPGIPKIGGTTAEKVANSVSQPTRNAIASACNLLCESDTRSAKRYRTIAENYATIERNFKLLNIGLEQFDAREVLSLKEQMNTYHPPVDLKLMAALKKYDMQSIAGKVNFWIMPFRRLGKPAFSG